MTYNSTLVSCPLNCHLTIQLGCYYNVILLFCANPAYLIAGVCMPFSMDFCIQYQKCMQVRDWKVLYKSWAYDSLILCHFPSFQFFSYIESTGNRVCSWGTMPLRSVKYIQAIDLQEAVKRLHLTPVGDYMITNIIKLRSLMTMSPQSLYKLLTLQKQLQKQPRVRDFSRRNSQGANLDFRGGELASYPDLPVLSCM